jgi:hypothetical protein
MILLYIMSKCCHNYCLHSEITAVIFLICNSSLLSSFYDRYYQAQKFISVLQFFKKTYYDMTAERRKSRTRRGGRCYVKAR